MVKPHDQLQIMLADVIAMVEDVKTTQGVCVIGRCYSHLWLMELPQVSIYFNLSFEMLNRTSSTIILLKDKLSPDFCHGFLWSEENVDLN